MFDLVSRALREVLICDGAMGTMLQSKGLSAGECPDEWNISHSDAVFDVHRGYVQAGADIILTNTFGANRLKLKRCGLEDRLVNINTEGAKLAREASGADVCVLGDMGPTGELIEPLGDLTYGDGYECFLEQALILKDAGVDGVIVETMSDPNEMKAAVSACARTGLLVIGSMTFQKGKSDFRTMMGATVRGCVQGMIDSGCCIIGTNCGLGAGDMVELVRQMRDCMKTAIIAQPNAGMPRLVNGKTVFDQAPVEMAGHVRQLIEAGANIVGGCCGTTPEHIREVAFAARDLRQ
jgi:5-methyltetrahydrofolate--homocysteine methyltransferase